MYLKIKSGYASTQRQLMDFQKRKERRLQRGTDCFFTCDSGFPSSL